MNKRRLHHYWTKFRGLKPWYFLAVGLVSGVICLLALRANNQHMVQLRDAVYAADKSGQGVDTALNNLRRYVYGHMNTQLASGPDAVYPPIQLKYTYDRLVKAASDRTAANNSQIYTDAQHYCEQQDPVDFSGHNRVPCVMQYVSAHGIKTTVIPDSLYKFDFVSPAWSPDLAGWSLVVTLVSLLLFAILFVVNRWFKQNVA
ncbi:MAG TPA: hypothetical protein VFH39_04290 [Candidatus Saccharimonadales bacterium]|nr:hypothetical protein [Candidatus Saccharimonadales bacterium]